MTTPRQYRSPGHRQRLVAQKQRPAVWIIENRINRELCAAAPDNGIHHRARPDGLCWHAHLSIGPDVPPTQKLTAVVMASPKPGEAFIPLNDEPGGWFAKLKGGPW